MKQITMRCNYYECQQSTACNREVTVVDDGVGIRNREARCPAAPNFIRVWQTHGASVVVNFNETSLMEFRVFWGE